MRLIRFYQNQLIKRPILSQSCTVGSLTVLGDAISQTCFPSGQNEPYDLVRTARFGFYGFAMVGPTVRIWFGLLEKLFPHRTAKSAVKKLIADQIFFAPIFQGVGIGILELLKFKPFPDAKKAVQQNYADVMLSNYKLWPAAQLFNFFVIPFQFRVLFSSTVALFWNVYFTWKLGQKVTI